MSSTSSKVLACLITISHSLSSFSIPYDMHSLECNWLSPRSKAHVGIAGNECADANASKSMHQLAPVGRQPPLLLCLYFLRPQIPISFAQAPISQQSDHLACILATAATHSLPRKIVSIRKPYLSSTTRQLISVITSGQHSPDQIHFRKIV